jgi:putative addiction module killer protein
MGNVGDVRSVGGGVSEMRIHSGLGYRLYFMRVDSTVVVLLCGGDKDSQPRDIESAKRIAAQWRTT